MEYPESKCCLAEPKWEDKDGNEQGLTVHYLEKNVWTGMIGICSKCNKKSEFLCGGRSLSNIVLHLAIND